MGSDFYCRGPYCVLSFEAVSQRRNLGFKARRLEDGLPEWKAADPVHRDEADGPGENVKPIVLSEGALSANHARYLNIM
jgi:hypothetical protein